MRMKTLTQRLSWIEAIGLSLAIVAPTLTAAFNVSLVVRFAGANAPLAFLIAALAIGFVALSFIGCSRRVAHAGSSYAYITHTFGPAAGFVAGWALVLAYTMFGASMAALMGSFAAAALRALGVDIASHAWIAFSVVGVGIAGSLSFVDMRLAGRLMLSIEGLAVLAILVLSALILRSVQPTWHDLVHTLTPTSGMDAWKGIGYSLVFCVLSFAGFEGATTLGEEAVQPKRVIPIAVLGSVVLCAVFFAFIAFVEVIGFGFSDLSLLASADAPLDTLSARYASRPLSVALDLAAAITCFSGTIGALTAGARILFALGRAGLHSGLAQIHPTFGTPTRATALSTIGVVLPIIIFGRGVMPGDLYSYTSTVAVLALILSYAGVGCAEMMEAVRESRIGWALMCAVGPLLLAWIALRTLVPVPAWPANVLPYITLGWVLLAFPVLRMRPQLKTATLSD
jgi:amino acid transporter